jgi:hypothetical protein
MEILIWYYIGSCIGSLLFLLWMFVIYPDFILKEINKKHKKLKKDTNMSEAESARYKNRKL